MDNVNVPKDLEKLLQEAKIRNEFEKDPMKGIVVDILIRTWLAVDPENVLNEFHDRYFQKMNFEQMITFLQANLDLLTTLKRIENEIDQNTKLES